MKSSIPTLCMLLVTVLALSSCSTKPPFVLLETPGGTAVMVAPPDDSDGMSLEALLEGPLAISPTDCLGVMTSDYGFIPAIFPAETSVSSDEPLTLTIASETYAVGDSIALSGGFSATAPLVEEDAYPEKCAAIEVFFAS